ncbi:MAG: response regulator transcription factor [Clostridia bacterium]|nr:response regulator transcription factor [Clostridia bacterium]
MKGTVFVLEDDVAISGLIKVSLDMNDISSKTFSTVKDFLYALVSETPDVALLDIMLPDGSGLDVLKYVKEKHPNVCCIMLSALGKEEDKVHGLSLGADDYVSKPFSVLELTARINAALRRNRALNKKLSVGDLEINLDTMEVFLSGNRLELNRKEFELLKYFMKNAGRVLSREELLTEIWGYEQGETRTLDNHVSRLRKLGVHNLETVFGIGYKFTV